MVASCSEEGNTEPSGVLECLLLTSDAEESDTRVWSHVVHVSGTKKRAVLP